MYVIGTAGHIDHGKSALIQVLTGIDPDRLREEKDRGMTIDLGFAWLKLSGGNEVGIIDVPGHEKFIKNMLAGLGGIDMVLFVVAANEGVMPQTKEHLGILNLMGIRNGIVVITKRDLVDDEILSIVKLEIEDIVKGSFLENAPIIAVSNITGDGIAELTSSIENILSNLDSDKDLRRPRLFVDRIFSIAGAGTVITGTLVDGKLAIADDVVIMPKGIKARIRGIQSHKKQINEVEPGSRVALNLVNVAPAQMQRGDIVTRPNWLVSTNRIDVKLTMLHDIKNPLQHGALISFFTGSSENMAKLHLLDRDFIEPGESAIAQFSFEDTITVLKGDHFVIRSPIATLGGGVIIYAHARRHRRYQREIVDRLLKMDSGHVDDIIMAYLEFKQPEVLTKLLVECNLTEDITSAAVNSLIDRKKIIFVGHGNNAMIMTSSGWDNIVRRAQGIVVDYHKKFPTRAGISKSELSSRLGLDSNSQFLNKLFTDEFLIEEGATVRLPSHEVKFSDKQMTDINIFLKQLMENPYSPQTEIILDKDVLNQLIQQQKIVKVGEGVIFAKNAYDEMVNKVMNYTKSKGKVTLGEVRDLLGTSRKYAQVLLEFMDEKKITKRIGDERVIRE